MFSIKKIYYLFLLCLVFLIHQYIFLKFIPNNGDLLGHDFEYFLPNFLFGKIWFENNFLSVPWFTPSFCCGIPYFADPQSTFYSIYQLIFIFFDPVISTKIIFFILSFFSYLGMYILCKKLNFNKYTALLCASLFLFNGFFVYRFIVGHLAFVSFIFIPLYCFFLIKSFEKIDKLSFFYLIVSSIIFANFFHSGSGPIILHILISIIITVFFYAHFKNNFKIFYKLIQSVFFGILISLSKITSSIFFLSNFPRQYSATEFSSFISYIKIFFSSFFLN